MEQSAIVNLGSLPFMPLFMCTLSLSREKYPLLFEEPVLLQANSWYVGLAKISGPSSDCGSNGQYTVTTDDQYVRTHL